MARIGQYYTASKKGRFVDGLPSFGYVYFLVNADDAERDPPAIAGTHRKIGASDVFARRMKSILIPIDWGNSVAVRFVDWQHAYAAEKALHGHGPIAALRDPDFLKLSSWNTQHRFREGMAGKDEWFHESAFDIAMERLQSDAFRAAYKWSRIIPAHDLVPGDARPQDAPRTATAYRQANSVLSQLCAMSAGKIVANCPNPVNDDYHVFLVVPKHAAADALLAHGQALQLPFVDGYTVPMFGPTVDLPAIDMQAAEMVFTRANVVERGREMDSVVNLVLSGLAAPSLIKLPKGVIGAIRASLGRDDMIVNGHLFVNARTNRWQDPGAEQGALLTAEDAPQLSPPAATGVGPRPEPQAKQPSGKVPGLFDEP